MTERKYIDWHSHTIYSDGADDPATVVRNSKLLGIESLAITDHDTMAGYREARAEAKRWRIDLVPGVEVTTTHYHILGLGIDPDNDRFNDFLKKVRDLQEKVCQQRIELLQKKGIPISLEKLKKNFPHSEQRIGKYNLFMTTLLDKECADYLLSHGYEGTKKDFAALLGSKGLVGKVEKKYFVGSRETINEIHSAGGIAIVAHPFKQTKSPQELDSLVKKGIDGLEIQPNYAEKNILYQEYAKEKGLLMTYGSDYHGSSFTRPLLGRADKGFDNLLDVDEFFNSRRVVHV